MLESRFVRFIVSMLALLVLVSCAPIAATSPLSAAWIPYNQGLPTHTTVLALAVDPRDPQKIFAGAYDTTGLYLSTDQARRWGPFGDGLDRMPVLALQFSGDQLFAGTTTGLYRLQNHRWARVEEIPPVSIYAIVRGTDDQIYIATDRRGIYSSSDAGRTWTRIPGLDDKILLSVAALDAQTIFVGTSGQGAFVTRERGRSWQALDLFTGDYVSFIAIDPRDRQTIFLRTRWGLFRSFDRGEKWQLLQGGIQAVVVNALLIDSRRLYAATSGGVLVSDDDGETWQSANEGLPPNTQALGLAQVDARTILAGMQTGVYITRNAGKTWQAMNEGLGVPQVHALVIQNSALIAATEDGLYRADVNGNFEWIGNEGMRWPMLSVVIAPSNPQAIYAGSYRRGIYISRDGGRAWNPAGDIFRGRLAAPGLAVDPQDDQNVFARVLFQRIYKSDDGGETWRAVWTGMSDDIEVETIAIAPNDPNLMYAGTHVGLFYSRDAGESWLPLGLSSLNPISTAARYDATSRTVFAIWIDSQHPDALLVGATDGVYRSNDAGKTWTAAGLSNITVTEIARDAQGNFFAGTKYNGVWISRDDAKILHQAQGGLWERFGMGLDDVSVAALVVDDMHGMIYAATTSGIFKANVSNRQGAKEK